MRALVASVPCPLKPPMRCEVLSRTVPRGLIESGLSAERLLAVVNAKVPSCTASDPAKAVAVAGAKFSVLFPILVSRAPDTPASCAES